MRNLLTYLLLLLLMCFVACQSPILRKPPVTIDLNGEWKFQQTGTDEWQTGTVPGSVQFDLLSNAKIDDPFWRNNEDSLRWIEEADWTYKRSFTVSETDLQRDYVQLVCEGLDTYATVKINGKTVVSANNMFRTWRADVGTALVAGQNEITVHLRSPMVEKRDKLGKLKNELTAQNDASEEKVSVFTRKAPFQFGWDWSPRLLTTGIWKPIRIEAWDGHRIMDINCVTTECSKDAAQLQFYVRLSPAQQTNGQRISVELTGHDAVFSASQEITDPGEAKSRYINLTVPNPHLWWPNGSGEPYLYQAVVSVRDAQGVVDSDTLAVGIRTIELVNEPDSIGTSFYFKVNGQPIFMKGANYIPQDNLLSRVRTQQYESLIQNAVDANMNMLRVWGGGIYENDLFYDLCDRNGILVWQDFMFANAMYPSDKQFVENVEAEARDQVHRLDQHPCIALWCGNNEINVAWHNWGWQQAFDIHGADSVRMEDSYKRLFEEALPRFAGPPAFYVPTSPLSNWGKPENFNHSSMHYWGVWHGEEAFAEFRNNVPRFMAEYGFQSFPNMRTIQRFSLPEDRKLDSDVMLNRQKSYKGSRLITQHMEHHFPPAKSFEKWVYQSQLTQAEAMRIAIEAHRMTKPHCMGTLYWQLNECWPGPSWSTIDYFGNWKAAHYTVKDLYSPVVVIPEMMGDSVRIWAVSDRAEAVEATLTVDFLQLGKEEVIYQQTQSVTLAPNESRVLLTLHKKEFTSAVALNNQAVQATLWYCGEKLHSSVRYFVPAKDLALTAPTIQHKITRENEQLVVELVSDRLAKNVYLRLREGDGHFSNNFFDLLPGQPIRVVLTPKSLVSGPFDQLLEIRSLTDDDWTEPES